MSDRRRLLKCLLLLMLTASVLVFFLGYYSSANSALGKSLPYPPGAYSNIPASGVHRSFGERSHGSAPESRVSIYKPPGGNVNMAAASEVDSVDFPTPASFISFSDADLVRDYDFDTENDANVLVFLHMQKTGGTTFGRYLVRNTSLRSPCVCYKNKKRCDCENSRKHTWLFSRYSTGWACGLHADWTELHACVQETLDAKELESRARRYLYFTILRDPIQRYLSEWKHVQRGSTWLSAKLMCNGRQATLHEVPFCFQGDNWEGVSLDDFMACPYNLAHNRQTRMLANLSLIGCYNRSVIPDHEERDRLMLLSAKENLRGMAFFSLTEYQPATQYLFERTFRGVRFTKDFVQFNNTHASKVELSATQQRRLEELNSLDVELYRYALELFATRLQRARRQDSRIVGRNSTSIVASVPRGPAKQYDLYDDVDGYEDRAEVDEETRVAATVKERTARSEKSRRRKADIRISSHGG